jgi:uncharacterized damage-inducible protein DinB
MDTRKLIITRLAQHLDEIHGFTDGLAEDQLKERPAPGRWSLHEIAVHLMETQDIFVGRLTRMLVEEKPEIVPFRPDQARQEGLYLQENLPKKLVTFAEQRGTLLKLLQTLTDEQWKLEGAHPEIYHYTIEKCMEALMRHEEHHLYQMYNVFFGVKG